jgi:hypothetical protein
MNNMKQYEIIPEVDQTQEFIEIANDFSNPLEIVREAISNAFDAEASNIWVYFNSKELMGERILEITLRDDGKGMDNVSIKSFFDLGNSSKREDKSTIGEKGHGTKVYFNSAKIIVTTNREGRCIKAEMNAPFKTLYNREIPKVSISEFNTDKSNGTEIIVTGYNHNRSERFTHSILKDYIRWFTKFGSIELLFGHERFKQIKLFLKGLDRKEEEQLAFGHLFPSESSNTKALFDQYLVKAPDYYCKHIVKKSHLKNFPDIEFEAIFSIEGNRVKYGYNDMLRRPGYTAPNGSYTVQDRYGLWLCKDYIPIQKKNDWISFKGYEWTKFHAFINCQKLRLTANRGSMDNTPSDILEDIKAEVLKIYNEITEGDDWRNITWLEDEAIGHNTVIKEKKDYDWRIQKVNKTNISTYKDLVLIEPQRESGVFSIVVQLLAIEPKLFPFVILDYDTHSGIDIIVKGDKTTPINSSKLFYVEFKHFLTNDFNHSFENVHSIICWETELKHDQAIKDLSNEERKLKIVPPADESDYVKYFLDNERKAHKIEVFVLKDYLKHKLGIEFRPRTSASVC